MNRFRGGLVFKAHRLEYHSTLGWRVIKKKYQAVLVAAVLIYQANGSNDKPMAPTCAESSEGTRRFWSLRLKGLDSDASFEIESKKLFFGSYPTCSQLFSIYYFAEM